ncbi:MAG: bacteriohemerythrin [Bacteroidota bacterium]
MKFVQWIDEKYSVKIQKIDEQHQMLIKIINEVFEAKTNDLGKMAIAGVLKRMTDYAQIHFKDEEVLMAEHVYPELEEHRSAHQYFITKVADFNRGFNLDQDTLTEEMLNFLKNWLLKHIMETDKRYSPFLIERGVR